jgi:PPOX class probable F420-dependent enzyme
VARVTRADGRPHVTPIWFLLDGDDVVFTTHESGVKAKALRRDPRATLCVDDQQPPYSFVTIEGEVSLADDDGSLREWTTALGARYMGADRAGEFGARNAVPGELLARLRIGKVIAQRDVAS